jgi:DNA-dependent RNA polymerase auxiliary subunit epsilon
LTIVERERAIEKERERDTLIFHNEFISKLINNFIDYSRERESDRDRERETLIFHNEFISKLINNFIDYSRERESDRERERYLDLSQRVHLETH